MNIEFCLKNVNPPCIICKILSELHVLSVLCNITEAIWLALCWKRCGSKRAWWIFAPQLISCVQMYALRSCLPTGGAKPDTHSWFICRLPTKQWCFWFIWYWHSKQWLSYKQTAYIDFHVVPGFSTLGKYMFWLCRLLC